MWSPAPKLAAYMWENLSIWADAVGIAVGYCLGSIPVGLWLGLARRGLDVRDHGSGSTGATNVLRIFGPGAAVATFGLDLAKGAAAVALASWFGADETGQAAAGIAAMVGHAWPALATFRGGKSVATAFGALLLVAPEAAPWAVAGGLIALAVTRTVSVGSLTAVAAAIVSGAVEAYGGGSATPLLFALVAAALIASRHTANIRRLARGQEPKLKLSRQRAAP